MLIVGYARGRMAETVAPVIGTVAFWYFFGSFAAIAWVIISIFYLVRPDRSASSQPARNHEPKYTAPAPDIPPSPVPLVQGLREIPERFWRYTDPRTVEFTGVGDLFKDDQDQGIWMLVGPLPKTVTLPDDGHTVQYKIRDVHRVESISEFRLNPKAAGLDPAPVAAAPSVVDELSRLHELRLAGTLSVEEFELLKQRLIQRPS